MTDDPLPPSGSELPQPSLRSPRAPRPASRPWTVRTFGLLVLGVSATLVFWLGGLSADDPDAIPSKRPIAYGVLGLVLGLVLTITGRDPWTLAVSFDRLPWALRTLVALVVIGGLFTVMALFLNQHL